MRINKYIAESGVASRRKAEGYITGGKVKVNGKCMLDLWYQVKEDDIVTVNEKQISRLSTPKYIMLNKPTGVITTAREQFNRPCVLDIVESTERLYPVGRLDMDSEGLIILTNDGEFTNKITHPSKHVGKTYEIFVDKPWNYEDVQKMKNGVKIDSKVTLPAKINSVHDNKMEIVIFEGRNRQLRKMCEKLGYTVIQLKRTKIGNLGLDKLNPGEYRELSLSEVNKIWQ